MSMQMQAQVEINNSTLAPSFTPVQKGLQRKCISDECEERRKKKLTLQRSSTNQAGPSEMPPIVHEVLRSPGQPLDPATRALFEPLFGHKFSQVRVHNDACAAESARAVNALAYTVGGNMVFGAEQYMPATSEGRKLIAHELTHVLQQTALASANGSLARAEIEADRNVTSPINGQSTVQIGVNPGVIQRQEMHSEQTPEPGIPELGTAEELQAQALQADWQELYDVALQGTTGISRITAAEKAELAAKIADEAILRVAAKAQVERAKREDYFPQEWINHFKAALQTTAGEAYSKKEPMNAIRKAVDKAAEIADRAVVVARQARSRLTKLFKQHPLPAEPPRKKEQP